VSLILVKFKNQYKDWIVHSSSIDQFKNQTNEKAKFRNAATHFGRGIAAK
jgi:hypothetical protein